MSKRPRGRPPKGTHRGKSAVFSTRITPETRRKLEEAAKRSNRSLSDEIEERLSSSLMEDDEYKRKNIPTRDLCYLIEQMTAPINAPRRVDLGWKENRTWRNDKFLFLAFKAAISELLDRLAPVGEIDPQVPETLKYVARTSAGLSPEDAAQYETPEKYAHLTVQGFWHWFMTTERLHEEASEILNLDPRSHSINSRKFGSLSEFKEKNERVSCSKTKGFKALVRSH